VLVPGFLVAVSLSLGRERDRLVANQGGGHPTGGNQGFFSANRQFLVAVTISGSGPKSVIPFEHPRTADFVALDQLRPFPFFRSSTRVRQSNREVQSPHARTVRCASLASRTLQQALTDAFRDRDWSDAKLAAASSLITLRRRTIL